MIEMQIEGNMVSDDDGEGDSEEEPMAKGRKQSMRRTESAVSKKRMRAQSKTIIEMVDENDDVSSDEFLDNPGSLPRNSFGYDQSDQTGDPYIRDSALTLESAQRKSESTRYKGKKGGKDIKKGAVDQKSEKGCNSCCEGAKCIIF